MGGRKLFGRILARLGVSFPEPCWRCHGAEVILVPDLAAFTYGGERYTWRDCPACKPQ